MSYWGYRVDSKKYQGFFFNEVKAGRLRQGWGYKDSQDLRLENVDESAWRNLPIYNKVKKGDILLIPHIEEWDEITIAEATMDFDEGYKFEIAHVSKDTGNGHTEEDDDYGHIFPVKFLKKFSKHNYRVGSNIKETFKCRSRFWNIDRCAEDIRKILETDEKDLIEKNGFNETFQRRVNEAFDEKDFAEKIYNKLSSCTQAYEWEYILCEGFRNIFPDTYSIQTTQNSKEHEHGADIIIKIPGILGKTYVIAIQVKDYSGLVSDNPVEQINKADAYFNNPENGILIDKYIIITKALEKENDELCRSAEKNNITVLFEAEVKSLLSQMAKTYLGLSETE